MSRPSNLMPGCVRSRWFDQRRSMLYILYNEDRPAGEATPIRDAMREAHLAYLDRPNDIVAVSRPKPARPSPTPTAQQPPMPLAGPPTAVRPPHCISQPG